ncbi:unnamed protein product [Paramecium octaurelia]|uniref:Uncharacterized protein n=1 Tax=Paramecium octaurelia TaxID=43137 RepID=A0A8S1V0C7_PAROT|nr:unnamed protein product [Paramecium octaurelia]
MDGFFGGQGKIVFFILFINKFPDCENSIISLSTMNQFQKFIPEIQSFLNLCAFQNSFKYEWSNSMLRSIYQDWNILFLVYLQSEKTQSC